MVQAVIRSKKMLVLLGAALVLMLAVACSSESDGNGGSGASLSSLLAAAGGPEAAAQFLRSGSSAASTGIWVNGSGKASGEPDLGIISLGVEALAGTAAEARQQAAGAIDRVIAVLRGADIADRDIQTSHFNISPRYNTHEVTRCIDGTRDLEDTAPMPVPPTGDSGGSSGGVPEMLVVPEAKGSECRVEFERVLIGYQVTNTLTVKVRRLDDMGGIIDGASEAAGDLVRVNRVTFTIEDPKPLQAQAREEAIADLLAKASAMARLAGVELGRLVFLTETGGGAPQSFARMESAAVFGIAAGQSTSILAGELDVNVNVQGVFSIAP